MAGSYIVAGARTPIGKMSGALSSFSAADLGGFAIKAALERAGVKPEEVEHVIMGQVLMAGHQQGLLVWFELHLSRRPDDRIR